MGTEEAQRVAETPPDDHTKKVSDDQSTGAKFAKTFQVAAPAGVIYDDFDFVDHRFLPEDCQRLFSAQSFEPRSIEKYEQKKEKGPIPEKNLFTTQMRRWRSEVVDKRPGAPLFEVDNFEPVGILELIMGGDEMRSPSFLIGLNKSPEKGQGHACKAVKTLVSL